MSTEWVACHKSSCICSRLHEACLPQEVKKLTHPQNIIGTSSFKAEPRVHALSAEPIQHEPSMQSEPILLEHKDLKHLTEFIFQGVPSTIGPSWARRKGNPDLIRGVTYQELSEAAHGCWFCAVIYTGLSMVAPRTTWGQKNKEEVEVRVLKSVDQVEVIFAVSDSERWYSESNELEVLPSGCRKFNTAQEVGTCTASDHTFDFAAEQLKNCLQNHTECGYSDKATLPKRVLKIGFHANKYTVNLYHSVNEVAGYVVLSHCWGSKIDQVTTTRDTLIIRQHDIPWSALTKTFQDAVIISWKLGFEYIWIDSLCIIQDDRTDWEEQSAQMETIYQNAIFAICANHARDGNGGCFNDNLLRLPESWAIAEFKSDGGIQTIRARDKIFHLGIHDRIERDNRRKTSPLAERAWTLQERILPSRKLHYNRFELVWDCERHMSCQCDRATGQKSWNPAIFRQEKALVPNQQELLYRWLEVVNHYSEKAVTKAQDRLPALSGLAKRFAHAGLCGYLAGDWSCELIECLKWRTRNNDITQRHQTYIAPTWSWASVIGEVHFSMIFKKLRGDEESDGSKPLVCVEGEGCTLASLDLTGAVTGGFITLIGPMVEMSLSFLEHERQFVSTGAFETLKFTLTVRNLQVNFSPDVPHQLDKNWLYRNPTVYGMAFDKDFALVLRKSEDFPGCYERLGSLWQQAYHDGERDYIMSSVDEFLGEAKHEAIKVV
ncbi:MAG: hypothetical protein M1834_004640 [Cirrosporium novae-zelandiae]|nr:MAG: hypothetical protein M1834_004640 [Cirrosporium novae-zelandiae]